MQAIESVSQEIDVLINSYDLKMQMTDGSLAENICTYLQPGENYLSVQSPAGLELSRLRLVMSGKAYGV